MKGNKVANYLRSEIAKMAGVTIETLRYYEKRGLILPKRIENGYRIYSEEILDRLNFIKRAKEAGFTLEEIRKTLQLFDCQINPDDLTNIMVEGIKAKIKEIDARIGGLMEIREILFQIDQGLHQQHLCPTLQEVLKKK